MAGRIAGITIEIGGNTTKLQSALKGVDSQIKTLKSGLRDVDRLLKFNPTSTTLLTQKQQMLKQAIQQTKDRLDTLKRAQADMDARGVDKNSEEYQRLQREIIATEQQLKRLENEYAQVASVAGVKMQAVGQKMQEVGQKISSVGDTLTQKITVPLAALGAASIASFSQVDKGMDTIAAKTGESGQALENMKQIAQELATQIPTDFQTAGSAVGEVATRFKLTGDELQSLSGQFVKFAKLNNTDVASSVDLVQSAMAAFGLSADQAGAYLDTLNAVGQQTGADVNKLAQDMTTNAASLKEMGFSASDAAHFLGELSVNGVDSSSVMAGLKRAFAEATAEGKPLDQALSELQDTMKNADSDTEAYAAALDLFGNRAGPALAAAIREGRLSLDELGTSLTDNLGNVDETFSNTLDPVDEFKMAMNGLKVAGAELGKTLLSTLSPIIEKVRAGVEKLTAKWKQLSPAQQEMIVKIGLFAAAVGPVIAVIGRLVSGIGSVVSIGGKLVTLFSAASAGVGPLGAAFTALTGPVGIIVAAIGAVSAAVAYLYKTNEEFRNKCQEIWGQIKEIIGSALELIKTIIGAFVDAVKAFWDQWGQQIMSVVGTVFSWIATRISAALKVVQGIINTITAIIKGDWSGAWEAIKQTASAAWNYLKLMASTIWEGIKTAIMTPVNALKNLMSSAWDAIKSRAKGAWDSIKEAIIGPFKSAYDKVKGFVDKIKGIFPVNLGKLFSGTLTTISAKVKEAAGGASVSYSTGVQKFAKAYTNPYIFTTPALLGGALVGDRGGFRGGEMIYSRDNLMRDIREASNPITAEQLYNIVLSAIDHADMRVNISGREFGRIIREV